MLDSSLDLITANAEKPMQRRRFLQLLAAGSAAAMSFPEVASAATRRNIAPRKLAFDNLHTGEKLSLTYFEQGKYVSDALKEINHVLRDHRTDEVHPIDPNLLNFLYKLQASLDTDKAIGIISGYRSPATNEELRGKSSGVAKKSKHMLGQAIDIRIDGVESKIVRDAAISLRQGGVGYYSKSNFVHLDTGRFRHW